MTITKRILFGAGAAWFSRGLQVLLGLILLPVLFRTLPKEELGIWLLLGQSWATLGLLDFGFGVTLNPPHRFCESEERNELNASPSAETRQEIADLVTTGLVNLSGISGARLRGVILCRLPLPAHAYAGSNVACYRLDRLGNFMS